MQKIKTVFINLVLVVIIITPTFGQSVKLDKKLGEKAFKEVVKTYGIYENEKMNNYLNKVGNKLVSKLDTALFEYKFFILNNEAPNAFALPGGYVFITTGMIPILQSEDELAGIIGHEIIHANNRHSIRQIRKRILPTLLMLPINVAGAVTPGLNNAIAPLTVTESLIFASYSRKFETEADEQGIALAAKAGYNPLALANALNRLMSAIEFLTGEKEKKNYFADHPYTPTRDKRIKEISKKLKIEKSSQITKNFLAEFEGIIFGASPKKGINTKNGFINIENDFYVHFPESWTVVNNDSIVVGYSPSKTAICSFSIDSTKNTMREIGEEYVKKLSKKHKKFFVNSSVYTINNKEGYIVNFEEVFFSDTTFASVIWLPVGDNVYKINTMSDIKDNKTILSIIKSLRPLTKIEKESVMVKYISLTKANNNEILSDLCKRTKNLISSELTAIINNHNINDKLKQGDQIKIVLKKPYVYIKK